MQIDHYLVEYQKFYDEFFPTVTIEEKEEKCRAEMLELLLAMCQNSDAEKIDEALDVMNTVIAYLVAKGVHNPLYFGYLKLEKTAIKYRRKGEIP